MSTAESTPATPTTGEVAAEKTLLVGPGRPANPESARQKRLADIEARKAAGVLRLGRPTNPESPRQKLLREKAERAAAGIGGKRGRPVMSEDEKARRKAERESQAALISTSATTDVEVVEGVIALEPVTATMEGDTLTLTATPEAVVEDKAEAVLETVVEAEIHTGETVSKPRRKR